MRSIVVLETVTKNLYFFKKYKIKIDSKIDNNSTIVHTMNFLTLDLGI